jgi:murein L,D-transpeptidase YafK
MALLRSRKFPGILLLLWFFTLGAAAPETRAVSLSLPLKNPLIVIKKSQRKLLLYSGGELIRIFPVGLGFAPQGPKQKLGDGKTPEGNYFIVDKNPQSRFFLSLAINYPNAEDGRRALEQGAITKKQNKKIKNAESQKILPPWDTPLGGEIFIHGNGSRSDWTLGCIALDDEDMKELYDAVPVGTAVQILPE